ncbi:fibronectin type III-like domain-contianing protein [Hymenobacter sp. BT683]|uniref:Fibronectin type III-like domain-contianing protein n=1 Tax=Hymenobacter jeongseonensis TaxID=2791027 RepID=A0ABS0INC8_9BACT|nr:fibronectin type III-like domain-contianing protein [Hymenobacter jeongseonensis]MBF9239868.1 fibronectin type III-like domain-contianing protein [Hymenobacter jeongseonensis]
MPWPFAKTRLLQPGESQTLTFSLSAGDLASYDAARSAWVAEPGSYTVHLGSSSAFKQTSAFELEKKVLTEQAHKALTPREPITELTKK